MNLLSGYWPIHYYLNEPSPEGVLSSVGCYVTVEAAWKSSSVRQLDADVGANPKVSSRIYLLAGKVKLIYELIVLR